jgi:PKD repeat protein
MSQRTISKNIITVGAVWDITTGYTKPDDVKMSSFSSWGPADDGRIKPDIVANGTYLTSSYSYNNITYSVASGTSMSTPSVTGSIALLIQHYRNTFGENAKMHSSTIKALIINTADEAGNNEGPDYSFGWGLMNTKKAALKISQDDTLDVITEHVLENGTTYERFIKTLNNDSLSVTLVWTDPPGHIPDTELDPEDTILVNDLNLLIEDTTTKILYYPWRLDKNNPENAATKGENNIDNVEQIDIATTDSGHVYKISVSHKGTLTNDRQLFSLVLSGSFSTDKSPYADFYASKTSLSSSENATLYDASDNLPNEWKWNISPDDFIFVDNTDSTSQNPVVKFTKTGNFTITLTAKNDSGSSTVIKSNYITVGLLPKYCDAFSINPQGYISRVQLYNVDNPSTFTNIGNSDPNDRYYENNTNDTIIVVRGHTAVLAVTNSATDSVYIPYLDLFAWIDWNRNGNFYDTGELIVEEYDNGGAGNFTFTIPYTADTGITKLRIRTHYYNDYGDAPCGYTDYGEVEDYIIKITDGIINKWEGTINNSWNEKRNWSTGKVPDYYSNVFIPKVTKNKSKIVLSDTAIINSLNIDTDATLEINSKLTIIGDKP